MSDEYLTFTVNSVQFSLDLTLGGATTTVGENGAAVTSTSVTAIGGTVGGAAVTGESNFLDATNVIYGTPGTPGANGLDTGYVDALGLSFTVGSDRINLFEFGGTYSCYDSQGSYDTAVAPGLEEGDPATDVTLSSTPPCFTRGTLILTDRGEVAVEDLRIGDRLATLDGSSKPAVWIGRSTVSSRFADPLRSFPIRIRAGALGENLPVRDLLLSPDHAVLIDGLLVHAGALVNGSSIVRETRVPETFVYYHVELEDHCVIFAENCPSETFVDNVDRMNFDNWAEHDALYPQGRAIAELPYPRAKARRQVPQRLRAALDARAAEGLADLAASAA